MVFDGMSGMTVRDLWEQRAEKFGDKHFLVFRNREGDEYTFTYAQYNRHINRAANYFLDLGIGKGDTVAVHLRNSMEFMTCLFGLAKIGAIMVPVNEQNLERESLYVLDKCRPHAVVVEPDFLEMYRSIRSERPELVPFLLLARTDKRTDDTQNFIDEVLARSPQLPPDPGISDRDTVEVMFTSGTTSLPKGVEFTHANLIYAGQYTQWQAGLREDDIFLTTMPACHSNFQLAGMMPVIQAGATMVMMEKYSASRFVTQLRHYKATVIQCVSMMVRTLLLQPETPNDALNSVREALYFLPLDVADKEAFETRFGIPLLNSYGSTESVNWVITDYPSGPRRFPSVGRVGLGYQAKIVDDNGAELGVGEAGELLIKGEPGRTLMKGYYRDPENNAKALDAEGWLHTGDKMYMDEDGFFFFVDRKSNMIKRNGENISSTEIEDVLMRDDRVEEAAVIGVPDPIRDQAVKAFVVPKPGIVLSEEDILEYCKANLAGFKVPTIIEIRTDLPHTASMKVEKKLLH